MLVSRGVTKLSWLYPSGIFLHNSAGIVAKSAGMFCEKVLETGQF